MPNRQLLHKTKLGEFRAWMDAKGIAHRPGKGMFEVAQVLVGSGWKVIFDSYRKEHLTVPDELCPLVKAYLKESKNGINHDLRSSGERGTGDDSVQSSERQAVHSSQGSEDLSPPF